MFQVGYKIATSESSGKHPIAGGCYCYTFWVRQAISDEKMFCRPVDVFPAPQTHTSFVTTSITLSHKNSNLGKPCELSLFPTHSGSLRCFSVSYTVTSIFWSGCNNFVYLMTGHINSYHRVQTIKPFSSPTASNPTQMVPDTSVKPDTYSLMLFCLLFSHRMWLRLLHVYVFL